MSREDSRFQQFGEELRSARLSRNISIDEIAVRTRINHRYIEAIEAGDLGALPPGPYTRAFLREFARAVGLRVPEELAQISNSGENTSNIKIRARTDRDIKENPSAKPAQPLPLNAAVRATRETAKFANKAARSAARTTGNVIKKVETGAKEAVDAITSKALWEEAERVRRERQGLEPIEDSASNSTAAYPADDIDIRSIRSKIRSAEQPSAAHPVDRDFSERQAEGLYEETGVEEQQEGAPEWSKSASRRLPSSGFLSVTNLVIFAIIAVFAIVITFAIRMNKPETTTIDTGTPQPEIATEKPHTTATPKVEAPVATPTVEPVATNPNDSLRLAIVAKNQVWVSIAPDNKPPFRGMLKAGERFNFAAHDKFTLNLGNQPALDMTFNGQPLSHLPTIANSGIVVRDLVLTRDKISIGGNATAISGQNAVEIPKPVPPAPKPAKKPVIVPKVVHHQPQKYSPPPKKAQKPVVKPKPKKKPASKGYNGGLIPLVTPEAPHP